MCGLSISQSVFYIAGGVHVLGFPKRSYAQHPRRLPLPISDFHHRDHDLPVQGTLLAMPRIEVMAVLHRPGE